MIDAGGSSSSDVQPTASAMATVAKCRTRCPSQKRVRFPTLLKSNQDEIELRSITTRCPSHATRLDVRAGPGGAWASLRGRRGRGGDLAVAKPRETDPARKYDPIAAAGRF